MPHLCKDAALRYVCWLLCLSQVAVTQQSLPPSPDSTPQSVPGPEGTFCEQSAEGMRSWGLQGAQRYTTQVGRARMSSASLTAKVILGCWEGLKLGHLGEGLQTLLPCFHCDCRSEVCSSKRAHWLTGCPYLSWVSGSSLSHGDTRYQLQRFSRQSELACSNSLGGDVFKGYCCVLSPGCP